MSQSSIGPSGAVRKPGFIRVSRQNPCPVCAGEKWCSFSETGAWVICMRTRSDRPTKNGGWIHRVDGPRPTGPVITPDTGPAEDLWPAASAYEEAGRSGRGPEYLAGFAASRKVDRGVLGAFRVGWDESGGAIVAPMWGPVRNGDWGVRGLQRRYLNGQRRNQGRVGLFVPSNQHSGQTALACEGLTDSVSAYAMGFPVVGLPAASTGIELAAQYVQGQAWPRVVVVADRDAVGERSAVCLASRLVADGREDVRIIWPREPHKDLNDWFRGGATRNDLGDAIDQAEPYSESAEPAPTAGGPAPTSRLPAPWRPFPIFALPPPLRDFVAAASEALVVDGSMVALPLLSACAVAVGTTRVLRLRAGELGWQVYAIVWAAIVAASGTKKSPAQEVALRPLRKLDDLAEKGFEEASQRHELAVTRYEAELGDWKKSGRKAGTMPPEKPEPPPHRQYICSDVTIEGLALVLKDNPRGVLVARDELGAWLGSFDAYTAAAKDAQNWLELHRAGVVKINRKTSQQIRIARAAASVTGGIQPAEFRRLMAKHIEDGLLARFLLTMPPAKEKVWTEAEVPNCVAVATGKVMQELTELEFGEDGEPIALRLTDEAKRLWVAWYNEHAGRQTEAEGPLRYAFAKIEELPARLALVFELVENRDARTIGEKSVASGVELARWFAHETERIYATWSEGPEARKRRELVESIQVRGGRMTVRELQRGPRQYRDPGKAKAALLELVQYGLARSETQYPEGPGRKVEVFVLLPPEGGDGDTIQNLQGKPPILSPPDATTEAGCTFFPDSPPDTRGGGDGAGSCENGEAP